MRGVLSSLVSKWNSYSSPIVPLWHSSSVLSFGSRAKTDSDLRPCELSTNIVFFGFFLSGAHVCGTCYLTLLDTFLHL